MSASYVNFNIIEEGMQKAATVILPVMTYFGFGLWAKVAALVSVGLAMLYKVLMANNTEDSVPDEPGG